MQRIQISQISSYKGECGQCKLSKTITVQVTFLDIDHDEYATYYLWRICWGRLTQIRSAINYFGKIAFTDDFPLTVQHYRHMMELQGSLK